jgi:hypothetical protein
MLIDNIGSSGSRTKAVDRNYARVAVNGMGRGLSVLLAYLRNVGHQWWELDDYHLADIGKTLGDAHVEKLRHRPVIRDAREILAGDAPWRFGA